MVALPTCPAAGVTTTVRLAPEPPSTIPAFGTKVVKLDVAVMVRLAVGVSLSQILKAMTAVEVSFAIN